MKSLGSLLRRRISLSLIVYLVLIYVIVYCVLLGAELVIRGVSAEVLSPLIVLGTAAGWLFGRSKLKFWAGAVIATLTGILAAAIHVGGIAPAALDLAGAALGSLWNLALRGTVIDPSRLEFLLGVLQARFQEMIFNMALWGRDLVTGFAVYNQISTLLSWGFLLWTLAAWTAWITRRRDQPLWGVLPAGLMLSILMTYTLEKRILLVFLLGAGLTLIGLINQGIKQREWRAEGIKGAENVRDRALLMVVAFSLSTMVFAGLMPSIRIDFIADPFERWMYGDSTAGEGGSESGVEVGGFNSDLYSVERFAGLPRQKLIGTGPELAKRVVMIVKYPTTSFVKTDLPNTARYWRAFSYDQYTGTGWQSSPTIEVAYQPGQEIISFQAEDVDIITQEIRLSNALRGTLYSAGQPITLDQEALVSWRTVRNQQLNGDQQIVVVDDIFAVTVDHIIYQVRSLVPVIADEDLRQAQGEIPEWVSSRYLALPESVPDRVKDLAWDIVANQPTAYDQAKALETFLRAYPYTLSLPAPPLDRDVADYFLFDLQTGYCDYYATAMVVLARAVGLPARVVVGYVGGQYDPENDQYLVSEAEAHTWVEVYFPGHEWIPFEPTAAQSLISDQGLSLPLPPELELPPQTSGIVQQTSEFPFKEVGLGLVAFAILGIWIGSRSDWARLQHMDPNSLSLVIYGRLYRYGRWLGLGHSRSDTIYEFDRKLKSQLSLYGTTPRRLKKMGSAVSEISLLTACAVQANYSMVPVQPQQKDLLLKAWKVLRLRLRAVVWMAAGRIIRQRIFGLGLEKKTTARLSQGAADG